MTVERAVNEYGLAGREPVSLGTEVRFTFSYVVDHLDTDRAVREALEEFTRNPPVVPDRIEANRVYQPVVLTESEVSEML